MKYNELDKYIVLCKWMANANDDEIKIPSGDVEQNLADYGEDLKSLFESSEDVDIKVIETYLKSNFCNIISVEPIA